MENINDNKKKYEKLQFGTDYELKDAETKRSTVEARGLFLRLVGERKVSVIYDLFRFYNEPTSPALPRVETQTIYSIGISFLSQIEHQKLPLFDMSSLAFEPVLVDTPLLHYYAYVSSKYEKLTQIKNEIKAADTGIPTSPYMLLDEAIRILIPDWQNLINDEAAAPLRLSLEKWADKWNLTGDWCLEFALTAFRKMLIQLTEDFYLYDWHINENQQEQCLNRYWQRRCDVWASALYDFVGFLDKSIDALTFYSERKKHPKFEFEWDGIKIEAVWYPAYHNTAKEFETKMEDDFWTQFFVVFSRKRLALVGSMPKIQKKLQQFNFELKSYIEKVIKIDRKYTTKTPFKRTGELHFEWLIDYQIPPDGEFPQLAQENDCTIKTIRDGVNDVAELLGITLREPGGKRGRPFEFKEKVSKSPRKKGRPKGIQETRERNSPRNW